MEITHALTKQIKTLLLIFIVGLILSGLTAFSLDSELQIAHRWIANHPYHNNVTRWLDHVYYAVHETNSKYPFVAYGTDWLAFAHLVIAIAFIGPLKDPIKNIWVIEFGVIACLAVFPLAFIAGPLRNIPFFWQCIDCCFGVVGGMLLGLCLKKVRQLEQRTRFKI